MESYPYMKIGDRFLHKIHEEGYTFVTEYYALDTATGFHKDVSPESKGNIYVSFGEN